MNIETYKVSSNTVNVKAGGSVVKKESSRTIVVPQIEIGKNKLALNQLSEGTYRALALVFYLVTNKSQLLLIEEPEVCIHRGLLNGLIELIRDFSNEKQIVVTTHSEHLLDKVAPEEVFVAELVKGQGTKVKSASEFLSSDGFKNLKNYLSDTGTLGDFWREGGFDNAD